MAPAWKPHKLANADAASFCGELVEGKIAVECMDPADSGAAVTIFRIADRPHQTTFGTLVSFGKSGDMGQWLADSMKPDSGAPPVYHSSQSAKIVVSFTGDVPQETRARVAEALDAL